MFRYSFFLLVAMVLIIRVGYGQGKYTYTIKADSVKITNCDSAELILENHTQNVPGFLFNTGNGRTIFKRGAQRLNDSIYLVGADTVNLGSPWVQGGNSFGTTGILGTLDNNHLDFYTNGIKRARLDSTGNFDIDVVGNDSYPNLFSFTNSNGTFPWVTLGGNSQQCVFALRANNPDFGPVFQLTAGYSTTMETFAYSDLSVKGYDGLDFYGGYGGGSTKAIRFFPGYRTTCCSALFTNAGNFQVGDSTTDNGNPLQVYGTSTFSDNITVANGKTLAVGGIYLTDYPSLRYITCMAPESMQYTSGAGGFALFDGNVVLGGGDTTNIILQPNATPNPAITVTSYTPSPSSTVFSFGNLRNDGPKKGVINTADFDAQTSTTGIDLYIYPGKETYSNTQANLVLSYDGTSQRGNVGIGTGSPTAQLHTTGSVRFAGLTQDNTQTLVLVSDANGNLYYRSAASLAAADVIRSSLAVNGPISAERLTLTGQGWADYVFDSAYHLPSLAETEDYIHHQHHLPDVPSAAEVKEKGADVGETQTLLLKKIEELTLYTIQQKKEIDKQNETIEWLKTEMEALKKIITNPGK